jgi:hypothetical protein
MTTPINGFAELAPNQSQPHIPVNLTFRGLEVLAQLAVLDRVATLPDSGDSPPPVDGDRYLLTAADSGGASGDVAYYSGGWKFLTPEPGWLVYVRDEDQRYEYRTDSSPPGWSVFNVGDALVVSPVVNTSAANLDATPSNSGNYTRFSHASATYTFDDAEAYNVGDEYHGRYVGSGTLTITEAGGMTVNAPAGGTLVIPPSGTFTVKIVGTDEADLIGVTVPV